GRELHRILHRRNLQDANADAVRGNAEAHAASRELVLRKEPLQRVGERIRVAHLTCRDDAALEGRACKLEHLGRAVVVHERGRELRRADAKSDDLGRVAAAAQARQREARKARLRQVDLALQTRRRRALLLLRRLRLLLLLGLLGLLGRLRLLLLLRLPDLLLPDRRRALGRARRAGLRLPRGRDGGDLRRRLLALPSDADLPRPELRRLEAAAQQVVEERVDDPVEVGRKD